MLCVGALPRHGASPAASSPVTLGSWDILWSPAVGTLLLVPAPPEPMLVPPVPPVLLLPLLLRLSDDLPLPLLPMPGRLLLILRKRLRAPDPEVPAPGPFGSHTMWFALRQLPLISGGDRMGCPTSGLEFVTSLMRSMTVELPPTSAK